MTKKSQLNKNTLLELLNKVEIPSDAVYWKKILPENIEEQLREAERNGGGRIIVEEIGKSREIRKIFGVRISKSVDNPTICVIANNHAEEVMGTFTCLFLIRKFTENREFKSFLDDFSFSFVPQANPDGVKENSKWIKKFFGSSDTPCEVLCKEYLLHKYRDLRVEDVEHGIPVEDTAHGIRPETEAVKSFIDNHSRIDYFISLHGNDLAGGVSYYCHKGKNQEENLDQIMDLLTFLSNELTLPLDCEDLAGYRGDEVIRDGFRVLPTFEEMKKQHEKAGEKPKDFKLNTVQYASRRFSSTFTLGIVTEIPLFYDKFLASKERCCISRYEVKRQIMVTEKEIYIRKFEEVLKRLRNITGNKSLDYFSRLLDWEKEFVVKPDKNPKGLEMFRCQDAYKSDIFRLIIEPYLLNMKVSSAVLKILENVDEGEQLRKECSQKFEENYAELIKRLSLEVIPPDKQLKLQLGSILGGMLVVV